MLPKVHPLFLEKKKDCALVCVRQCRDVVSYVFSDTGMWRPCYLMQADLFFFECDNCLWAQGRKKRNR